MHFSFIYFDVGGVVIRDFSDTNKWEELQAAIGVNARNKGAFNAVWARYRKRICVDFDVDNLLPIFAEEVGLKFDQGYSFLADFVTRFEKNPSMWPLIRSIHEQTRVGLLTNMYPRMLPLIESSGLLPPENWDVIIDSSVVGYQKPDEQIFRNAQESAGVDGSKILFIDNGKEHVEAARRFGWQAHWYDSSNPDQATKDLASILFE